MGVGTVAIKIGGAIVFPSHDPDKQDEELALELAAEQARDAVIAAARQICPNVLPAKGEGYIEALEDALATLDAAVKAADAHSSTVAVAVCRECGCTEEDACVVRVPDQAGALTCWWVEDGLCSACGGQAERLVGPNDDHRRAMMPDFDPERVAATRQAWRLVEAERDGQDAQWGKQRHGLTVWMTVHDEEAGEASKAILTLRTIGIDNPLSRHNQLFAIRKEFVQMAAVAVAMIEHINEAIEEGRGLPSEVWE